METQSRQACDGRGWRDASTAKGHQGRSETTGSWKRLEGSALQTSEEACPSQYTDFGLLASRTVDINFCCFKPLGLWLFVVAATGNEYTSPGGRRAALALEDHTPVLPPTLSLSVSDSSLLQTPTWEVTANRLGA